MPRAAELRSMGSVSLISSGDNTRRDRPRSTRSPRSQAPRQTSPICLQPDQHVSYSPRR
jgi:hypothetical protein